MISLQVNKLKLTARKEGNIKSYESCTDVRAWSHDFALKDSYLREWMRADSPVCYIPSHFLAGCLLKMTCKSLKRAVPYCHPDCKSKAVLQSICNACQVLQESLRKKGELEQFFVDEEFETSHWPCDRSLDAMKTIKMMWKILVNKLFGINVSKYHRSFINMDCLNNVPSLAKAWQDDMKTQAYLLEASASYKEVDVKKTSAPHKESANMLKTISKSDINKKSNRSENISKSTFTTLETIDCECNTCLENEEQNKVIDAYKVRVTELKKKCDVQTEDINRLRKENIVLKTLIENVRKCCPWKAGFCLSKDNNTVCRDSGVCVVPKLEAHFEEICSLDDVDSEMIITMENGKNESFRHVSLLQVLHKTNNPLINYLSTSKNCLDNGDPLQLLNKVNSAVNAIVRREKCLATNEKYHPHTKFVTSFQRPHSWKSTPSCVSLSS